MTGWALVTTGFKKMFDNFLLKVILLTHRGVPNGHLQKCRWPFIVRFYREAKGMTVKELMNFLRNCDSNAEVVMHQGTETHVHAILANEMDGMGIVILSPGEIFEGVKIECVENKNKIV